MAYIDEIHVEHNKKQRREASQPAKSQPVYKQVDRDREGLLSYMALEKNRSPLGGGCL